MTLYHLSWKQETECRNRIQQINRNKNWYRESVSSTVERCDQEKRVADGKSWANRKSAWKKWIENMRLFNRNKILSLPPKTEIVGNCYIVTQWRWGLCNETSALQWPIFIQNDKMNVRNPRPKLQVTKLHSSLSLSFISPDYLFLFFKWLKYFIC